MGWTKTTGRSTGKSRRLCVESLETRQLLSTVQDLPQPVAMLATPQPTDSGGGSMGGTNFNAITGAAQARSDYGVDGSGFNVAVIDTGVNYNHSALGGGFGPGHKVVAGFDFAEKDGDPLATWDHGTAVAGIIASSDPNHLGIAPGAGIVALRVFGNNNKGDFNRVADALEWVVDHHGEFNITVVNISLSDGNNYSLNWFANDGGVGQRITDLVRKLDTMNIPVVTATGNSFNGQQGQGFTSIVTESISVTATDANDKIVGNAQRLGKPVGGAQATDIAAPGAGIMAPVDGNNFSTGDGTSFAAPIVSGGIVLMQQVFKARFGSLPTVDQVDGWLENGADRIHDSVTGIDIGRIDIPQSIALIPPAPVPVPQPAPVIVEQVIIPTPPPEPTVVTPTPAPTPPAPTPTPDPTPPVAVTPPAVTPPLTNQSDTTVDGTDMYFNGKALTSSRSDKLAARYAALLQSVFNGQLKNVRIWGTKVSTPAPTQSNPFAKAGLTNLAKVQAFKAATVSEAHPTGRLSLKNSNLQQKRRSL